MKFRPIQDRIIVRVVPEKSAAGIELPPSATGPHRHGVVEAAGDGMRFMDGVLHALRCKAGDRVIFEGGEDIRLEGEKFVMLREAQVIGISEKGNMRNSAAPIKFKPLVGADWA